MPVSSEWPFMCWWAVKKLLTQYTSSDMLKEFQVGCSLCYKVKSNKHWRVNCLFI